jgi:hypothetical protein
MTAASRAGGNPAIKLEPTGSITPTQADSTAG